MCNFLCVTEVYVRDERFYFLYLSIFQILLLFCSELPLVS